jgi:hypothetical protein
MSKKEVRILQTINRTCNCQIDYLTAEYDQNNDLLPNFLYSPAPDEPIRMIDKADENDFYYHFDGLGSAIAL